MIFKPLSVAENDYKSDCVATVDTQNYYSAGGFSSVKTKFEVYDNRKIIITSTEGDKSVKIEMRNTDIEGLIEFLKDAQLFINEAKLFNTIRGK